MNVNGNIKGIMIGPWRIMKRRGHRTGCELFDVMSQTSSSQGVHGKEERASVEGVMVTLKMVREDRDTHILMNEAMVLRELLGSPCFPQLLESVTYHKNVLVLHPRFGEDLNELRLRQPSKKLPSAVGAEITLKILECLEALHDRGYVCRDVKPSAFVRREGGGGRELMLAELGVARSLKAQDGSHIKERVMPQDFKGPPKYASPLVHAKKDSSYRDDFFSAIYVFAELLLSRLPWVGDSKDNMEAHKQRVLQGVESLIPELLINIRVKGVMNALNVLTFEERPSMKMVCDQFDTIRKKRKEDVISFPWAEPPPLPPPPPHDLPPLPPGLSQPQPPLLQTGSSLQQQQVPHSQFLPLHLAPPPPPLIFSSMSMANTATSDYTARKVNEPITGDDSADDVEMEIEDEENETVVHKDNSKALKTDKAGRTALRKHDVSIIKKTEEDSEMKKWEINLKKMEDDLLESSVASGGEQRCVLWRSAVKTFMAARKRGYHPSQDFVDKAFALAQNNGYFFGEDYAFLTDDEFFQCQEMVYKLEEVTGRVKLHLPKFKMPMQ